MGGNGKEGKGWEKGVGEWKAKGHTGTSFSALRTLCERDCDGKPFLPK